MTHASQNKTLSPFAIDPDVLSPKGASLVAILGLRNGYLQLSTPTVLTSYDTLPLALFEAAKAWAGTLERLGAPRVYWITLSEVVTHLHIHLYPRWPEDEDKGIPLFEARNQTPQPAWSEAVKEALNEWAAQFNIMIIES